MKTIFLIITNLVIPSVVAMSVGISIAKLIQYKGELSCPTVTGYNIRYILKEGCFVEYKTKLIPISEFKNLAFKK